MVDVIPASSRAYSTTRPGSVHGHAVDTKDALALAAFGLLSAIFGQFLGVTLHLAFGTGEGLRRAGTGVIIDTTSAGNKKSRQDKKRDLSHGFSSRIPLD
jgi:hypothetical protein